ncbi:unnamed protein product [Peronospora belbahrii]|uniref:Uncharacterized protein n=1 Tax=Peronospora belbahrii TaxID=622444 RepID=A0ABN8CPG4_9STRA|nr:unnamed protein product [Peronospora belbahrii]
MVDSSMVVAVGTCLDKLVDIRDSHDQQQVTDLVLTNMNMRYNIQLGLLDPMQDLVRMYSDTQPPSMIPASTAALYVHYMATRVQSVGITVPVSFWAGITILRALAVYVTEPLYVLDVKDD